MQKDEVHSMLQDGLRYLREDLMMDVPADYSPDLALMGENAPLDSLATVQLLVFLEQKAAETGQQVEILGDVAVFANEAILSSAQGLVDFIHGKLTA